MTPWIVDGMIDERCDNVTTGGWRARNNGSARCNNSDVNSVKQR
jgi:hypothetical protein